METSKTETEIMEQFILTRDPNLREELIIRSVPLVHFVLGRLGMTRYRSENYEDLESQGLMGLIEAVDNYKAEYGTKLSTYATLKIRSKVLDYLREMDWLPRTARQRVRIVQDAMVKMETDLQRVPSDEELALHLGMDIAILQQTLIDSSHYVVSLDDDRVDTNDDSGTSLYDKIVDENQGDPSIELEELDSQQTLVQALKRLPEREQLVLSLYYYEELTFKEIGKTLDISESRVCQIHGRAVIDLKGLLESKNSDRPGK